MKLIGPRTVGPLALAGSAFFASWMSTVDLRIFLEDLSVDPRIEGGPRFIYLCWHEMLLFPGFTHAQRDIAVLVSRHRDGELIARILRMLGFSLVRGSSTRFSFSALRGLMRKGRSCHLAITPDGPLGPRRVVKPGCIYVASQMGMPIVPGGFAFRNCWRVRSWDRMALPKPYTVGICVGGKPVIVPPDCTPQQIEEYRQIVQDRMDQMQSRAEAAAAGGKPRNHPALAGTTRVSFSS